MTEKKLADQIIELYRHRTLATIPSLTQEQKIVLASGLEKALTELGIVSSNIIDENERWDSGISYGQLRDMSVWLTGHKGPATRMENCFRRNNVTTYRDIGGLRFDRYNRVKRHGNVRVIQDKHVGRVSSIVLYAHMSGRNLQLFDTPYTPEELGADLKGDLK